MHVLCRCLCVHVRRCVCESECVCQTGLKSPIAKPSRTEQTERADSESVACVVESVCECAVDCFTMKEEKTDVYRKQEEHFLINIDILE